MGKSGFKGGNLHAQNLQAGNVTVNLGGTGTDTTSVSFAKGMENVPKAVAVTVQSDKAITQARAYSITKTGFTLKVVNGNSLTGDCTFGYVAYDDRYR
jgi:hypothetical protein